MERILIISDTHGSLRKLKEIIQKEPPFDYCIHLGDSQGGILDIKNLLGKTTLYMVAGNCDMFIEDKLEDIITLSIGKNKCLLTHGHLFNAKSSDLLMINAAKKIGADYIFYGHTHIARITKKDGITLVNPGSLTYPREKGATYIVGTLEEELSLTLKEI